MSESAAPIASLPRAAIALDLGGSSIKAALVALDGTVRHRMSFATRADRPALQIETDLVRACDQCRAQAEPTSVSPVGLALPGLLSPDGSTVVRADNLPTLNGWPLVRNLRQRIGKPLAVVSDSLGAAVAERRLGLGAPGDRCLVAVIGTGIGVALIDNDRIQPIPRLGQVQIPSCDSGNRVRLETVASGLALDRAVHDAVGRDLDYPAIRAQLENPDDAVRATMTRWAAHLMAGFDEWIAQVSATRIVVTGGITGYGPALLEAIRAARHSVAPVRDLQIDFSPLGRDAVLIGAGLAAMNSLA